MQRMNLQNNNCPYCSSTQHTQEHVVFECSKFREQRQQLFQQLQTDTSKANNELFNKPQNVHLLQKFLAKTFGNAQYTN